MSITVIIPVFNDVKYVKDAINSVIELKEVSELIIVEDGSSDGSRELCQELAKLNEKIQVYFHDQFKNRGASASRNLGISKSTGKFITFLDADDLYNENRFRHCYQYLQSHPDVDMVYEPVSMQLNEAKMASETITFIRDSNSLTEFECYFMCKEGWIHLNSVTFRRSAFEKIGFFDTDLLRIQDTDFILRSFKYLRCHGLNMSHPVAIHRNHSQIGANFPDMLRKYRILFYQKWYKIIMSENHHPLFIRHFLNRMIYYKFDGVYTEKNRTLRKLKKLFFLVKLIRQDIRILSKIV